MSEANGKKGQQLADQFPVFSASGTPYVFESVEAIPVEQPLVPEASGAPQILLQAPGAGFAAKFSSSACLSNSVDILS